jgi:phosphate transport system protein
MDVQVAVQLAIIGRFFERIGDHAVNVGERTLFILTGVLPEHRGAARFKARHSGDSQSSSDSAS